MSTTCERVNVSLGARDLADLDAIAAADAGEEVPNRSKAIRRLIRDERKRRESPAAPKSKASPPR